MALTLRGTKGAPLTHAELDNNFTYLNALATSNSGGGGGGTGSKQIIDVASRYGVLGVDGVDYTAQLMQMRADLSADNSTHYVINMPGGHVKYTNNRWLFGIKSFTLEGNGTYFIPRLTDEKFAEGGPNADNMLTRTFFNGEMLQTNVLDYNGRKDYVNCPKIFTAAAGASTIKVQNPAEIADTSIYFVGARITIASKETVFDGYPWGVRNFENINVITAINYSTGDITLKYVLKYQHTVNNPECSNSSGGGSGIGRIIPLDNPVNVYCEYAEFKNLVSLNPYPGYPTESFVFIANQVVIRNCEFPGLVTPSETLLSFKAYDSKFGGGEFDKLVGDMYYENVDHTWYFLSNGGGCRSLEMVGGSVLNSFQPNTPIIKLRNVTLIANVNPTPADVPLSSYPGFQPIYHYEIEGLNFVFTPASTAQDAMAPESILSFTITQVEADGTIVIQFTGQNTSPGFNIWKSLDVGFGFWKQNGSNGGVVTSLTYDPSYTVGGSLGAFRLQGSWNRAVVGEVWNWSYIKKFVDKGGHRVLTSGKGLFDKTSYKLKGKDSNSKTRKMYIPSTDLKANAFVQFPLQAFVTGIELVVDNAMSSGRVSVAINFNPPDNITPITMVNFALTSNQKRKFDEYGAYSLQAVDRGVDPDLNQYVVDCAGSWANSFGVYCGNIDENGLGNFTLIVSIREY